MSNAVAVAEPLDARRKRSTEAGKREIFVMQYVACKGNGAEAARLAGYSVKAARVQASKLLTDPRIREAIVHFAWKAAKEIEVDGHMVLQELASIAFAPVTPGYIRASDKTKALDLLGVHLKLWEGSRGDRTINFNILQVDLATL